jgi:hypothetical protein
MLTMQRQTEHFPILPLVNFTDIRSNEIDKYWPQAAPFIRAGLGEGEILEHVHLNLVTCKNQLWAAFRDGEMIAACVTELVTIGGRDVCNVRAIGGTGLHDWLPYLSTIEAWARANGRSHMRFPEVRKGWAKILKDYRVRKVTLEKEL